MTSLAASSADGGWPFDTQPEVLLLDLFLGGPAGPVDAAAMPQQRLVDWVRLYLNDELQWDAQLVLSAAEVPVPRLGATDGSARLGYSTWLHTRPLAKDADDLVLNPV